MKLTRHKIGSRGLLALCIALSAACANTAKQYATPEEAVRDRAQLWADALLDGDVNKAYEFTSPAYRKTTTIGRYYSRVAGAGNWVAMKVESVSCENEACQVRFMLEYKHARMKGTITQPMDYRWLQSGGQWWLYVPFR